jgi:putative ABC transport system permease protein
LREKHHSALKFLRWFCDPEILEDLEGDLQELYLGNEEKVNYSSLKLWWEVLKLFRPGIIKNIELKTQNSTTAMFKNYLISSWRHLLKHQRFTLINILSLSIGIAACIIIFLFIQDEQQFDGFHKKRDEIYRLCEVQSFPGTNTQNVALSMPGMGPTMLEEFPEITNYTRFWGWGKQSVTVNGQTHLIEKVAGVDSTFLQIFDFEVLAGGREGIESPYDCYISESVANRLFQSTDVVGEQLDLDGDLLTIRGVLADIPENSHLQFDMLANAHLAATGEGAEPLNGRFGSNYVNTYFTLNQGADLSAMADRYPDYLSSKMDDPDINDYYQLFLQPLEQVHLGSMDIEHDYNNYRKFNGTYIDVFFLIGIFILIIASVNFMNLTTARASIRAKEVGVRKTIGANKQQLFVQFILESCMMALVALILAIGLDFAAVPGLNGLIDRQFSMLSFLNTSAVWMALGMTVLLGVLTGLYPSIYLSSFKPVVVLKGLKIAENKSYFRSGLVVLQFSLAIGLIVCTLIVVQQLNFMKNKDLGFNTDHIITVDLKNEAREKYETIKEELLTKSSIKGVTASGQRLGNNFHQWGFKARLDTGITGFTPSNVLVDYDYLDVYEIDILHGRNFSKDYATDDGLAFVVNQSFVQELGLDQPLGAQVGHAWYPDDSLGTIIGVTEDFNFNSLHYKVNTLSMVIHTEWGFSEMSVKLDGNNIQQGLKDVQATYDQFVSDYPFEYEFLDDHFSELYSSDAQLGSVITIVASLSILIGCMGLFGLASIAIDRRIKEIGIRKVMGASLGNLVIILSKNFGLLVLVSAVIAAPLSWLYLSNWLDGFAFRIDINPLVFVAGSILALLIAMLTISFHVWKAANSNPINSLRYE